jgi:glucosamine kinase
MNYLIGIDGGGTRTTLALADESGREILRRTGPAGLVDPRRPAATAEMLTDLVREAYDSAGVEGPADALCAGLAGVGNRAEREVVEAVLRRSGIARRVSILPDGETALYGSLGGGAGILVIAGTGSVAHGRAEDGRVERCGGWGMVVGDEGSGYALGRAALRAALHAVDGRGPQSRLVPAVLEALGLSTVDAIPPWAGRAEKSEIASLAVHALRLAAENDAAAMEIVRDAAAALAKHVSALAARLAPWSGPIAVVLHGGLASDPSFRVRLTAALDDLDLDLDIRDPQSDAVAGAVQFARQLATS